MQINKNTFGVYISLTSIYQNQGILIKTLKSIENQTLLPDKCFIYLSEEPYLLDDGFKNKVLNIDLSETIFSNSLFELIWTKNIGPYRKLLPLLKQKFNENCIIITIDDDTVYDPDLVSHYVNDYIAHNCCISYRAHILDTTNGIHDCDYKIRLSESETPRLWNFHTGKGGVVYHPKFFKNTENLIFNDNIYKNLCEVGDDVWFNLCRIINKIHCYFLPKNYMIEDNTQKHSLYFTFNYGDNNTIMIRRTIKKLIKCGYQVPNDYYVSSDPLDTSDSHDLNKSAFFRLSRLSLPSLETLSCFVNESELELELELEQDSESVSPHLA